MNKKLWIIGARALAVLVVIGSIGAIAVHAQSPTPTAPSGPVGRWGGAGNGPRGPHLAPAELDAAAKALGMSSADLSSQLQAGKSLSAIATEKGVALQTVQNAIQSARVAEFRTQINQAVTDGKMTQDKANWLLEGLDKGYINGPGFGFGFGFSGPGGPDRPRGGPPGLPTQQPTPTQP